AEKADQWFLANRDEDGHARISVNLGNLYHRLDQHPRAVEHHTAAVKIFRKLQNRAALAQCYLNLGDSLSVLDRFEESNRNFEKSRKLSQQLHLSELNVQARYNRPTCRFCVAGTATRFTALINYGSISTLRAAAATPH